MPILEDKQKEQLRGLFAGLDNEVNVVMFSREIECEHCRLTRDLLTEVSTLSDKIKLTVKNFVEDKEEVSKFKLDKIPATVIMGEKDYGIRYYGVPAGYEFTSLIEDIILVSRRDPGLPPEVLAELAKVDQPVHVQVMISPTCPYCPMAVRTAHKLAMANDNITADMVETTEFPHLVRKYDVQGVPHTVINEFYSFVGPLPELETAYEILRALGKPAPPVHVHAEEVSGAGAVHDHGHDHAHDHDHEHVHQHEHQAAPPRPFQEKPAKKAPENKAARPDKKKSKKK
ncbi:MAG TPA: thioredoxin family protein [bacterium]|nr:thioredoxin family protein [bacterium]